MHTCVYTHKKCHSAVHSERPLPFMVYSRAWANSVELIMPEIVWGVPKYNCERMYIVGHPKFTDPPGVND